ncbi:MAG: ABC transporter ATP-binding protein [Phocaeicola sp.]|nr:ABC transporter ATP-binding protein [Phocaeicola sp.]
MNNISIQFDHVGKLYQLGLVGTGTLSHDLNRWWKTRVLHQEDPYLKIGETNDRSKKGSSDFVWALKDITFDVEQGDVVGIIGKNGAGKSTLLKLLSRITSPSTGTIRARGRIGSLLEVGTGFHPELTGRENIYMNGSIMGMTRAEITRKLDEIVDFAGVERYLDTTVKRYSSGMTVRVGFAVAAFMEPEILVVDEVLAVGDAEFQKKAIGKMQDVSKGEGRTVLFVSHNMNSVKILCNKGFVLHNGTIEYQGTAEDCVNKYIGSNISEFRTNTVITNNFRKDWMHYLREIEFLETKLYNNPNEVGNDESITLGIKIRRNNMSVKQSQFTVNFVDDSEVLIESYISPVIHFKNEEKDIILKINISNHGLTKRNYYVNLVAGVKDFSQGVRNFDRVEHVLSFSVTYYQKALKKEYLIWDRSWGAIAHNNENIQVEKINSL